MTIKTIGTMMTIAGLCFSSVAAAATKDQTPPAVTPAAAETLAITLPNGSIRVKPPVFGRKASRPAALTALYASLGAMQALDVYSTSAALKAGAHEANPLLARFAGNTGAMLGLKAATTASTIFFAERMWKKNRTAAVVLMAIINGATAAVAAHNLQNARILAARR